jgi:hypothetical protein
MRRLVLLAACAVFLAHPLPAQTKIEATDLANHPFSVEFPDHGTLKLKVRSGEVRLVGTNEPRITVELSGSAAPEAKDVRVRFEKTDSGGRLRVSGGPKNRLRITVRVPATVDLYARIPFGDVDVENFAGSQDVEIHAGDLRIGVRDPGSFAHVDASVYTGELDAHAFGEEHGGLFRSFRRTGTGPHTFHAHVGAGQLTIRSSTAAANAS